jgi:uncharacterized spore protein YtfJ
MANLEILRQLNESLGATASVRSVFGEPIHAQGKTVIPVARVVYGFGGGSGSGRGPKLAEGDSEAQSRGEGAGGGGGVHAYPAGALEITSTGTRFIGFPDYRWLLLAFSAGALGAWWLTRKPRR